MKKKALAVLAAVVCLAAAVSLYIAFGPHSKSSVTQYVRDHGEELTAFALETIEAGTETGEYQGWDVLYLSGPDNTGIVQFTVSAWGLVPSTTYKGFYYSPSGQPSAFQGVPMELTPEGEGWAWADGNSPRGYTEEITGPWYWFEVKF